ncbi:MAG: hypothetical protein A2252_01815 [Elusimicrobia bacterium RIFOXYA2_FULL_39_19]|nr:MAG: hypothetical protein A2252_01815 [Elusimicrobia bacterium RIFOXYA2_FULL_39_19]
MFSKIITTLTDFIFPKTCPLCESFINTHGKQLCENCFRKIEFVESLFCQKCGISLKSGGAHCYHCLHPEKGGKIYYEYLRGVCVFDGVIKDMVHQFKYARKEYLSKTFSNLMISYLQNNAELLSADIVIPVPLYWYRKFRRGYNQSALLAKQVAQYYRKPLAENVIYRKKFTKPQVGLSRAGRLSNIYNAFSIKNPEAVNKKTILVIDDVCTTGETINQCAKVLRENGAKKVYGLTLARDE